MKIPGLRTLIRALDVIDLARDVLTARLAQLAAELEDFSEGGTRYQAGYEDGCRDAATIAGHHVIASLGFIDQTIYANDDSRPDLKWSNAEVMELLNDIRSMLLTGAVTPGAFGSRNA